MFSRKEVRIVFQPKERHKHNGRRRFGVGAKNLATYIGESNVEAAFKRVTDAKALDQDKVRCKFRVQGIVDIYFI